MRYVIEVTPEFEKELRDMTKDELIEEILRTRQNCKLYIGRIELAVSMAKDVLVDHAQL